MDVHALGSFPSSILPNWKPGNEVKALQYLASFPGSCAGVAQEPGNEAVWHQDQAHHLCYLVSTQSRPPFLLTSTVLVDGICQSIN